MVPSLLCHQIPVHMGSKEAMVVPYDNKEGYHGSDGFNDLKFDSLPDTSRVSSESAVDAIRKIVAAHPGMPDRDIQITHIDLSLLFFILLQHQAR